jgi:putative nucleotidyltransferase with HDIG domain
LLSPTLLVRSGSRQGSTYTVRDCFRIGRHPDNHLQLSDKEASRYHAVIEYTRDGFRVRDLGSVNGTWVNGQRIDDMLLSQGSELRIGGTRMAFFMEPPVEGASLKDTSSVFLLPETDFQVRYRAHAQPDLNWMSASGAPLSQEVIQSRLTQLQMLYQTNMLLSSELELEGIFHKLFEQLFQALPSDRGVIFLMEPGSRELKVKYSMSRNGGQVLHGLLASRTIAQQVMQEGFGLVIDDAHADERFSLSESIVEQDIRSALCVPLLYQGKSLGMIYLDALGMTSAFSKDDLRLLTAMAAPAALQVRNLQYMDQVARAYLDTIQVLANAIEARDHYTVGHTWRVTRIALILADHMGWSADQRRYAEMGGILHDIGKLAVEDRILRKKGPLTDEEYMKMQLHPEAGARILKDVEFLKPVIPYVLFHQERWDGKGYPFQLKGEDIPIEGRLLAIPDALDAMTSHRPYREARRPKDALAEIKANRGSQFDPAMVDLFFEIWDQGKIRSIIQDHSHTGETIPCPFCSTRIPLGNLPREGIFVECPVCAKDCVILKKGEQWLGELA